MSSSSSKSPSHVPSERLSFLVKYGSSLGEVLRRRKMRVKNAKKNRAIIKIDPNITKAAVEDIRSLKDELKTAKQSLVPPSYSLDERGGKRVIEKLEGILNELIAVDSENKQSYKELLDEIDEMKDDRGLNLDFQKTQGGSGCTGDGLSYASQVLPFDDNNGRFEKAFEELPIAKKNFLTGLSLVYECISEDLLIEMNVEVSKGVLINWLTAGLSLVYELDAEQFVDDIVAEPCFNLMRACRSSKIILSKHFFNSLSTSTNDLLPHIRYNIIKVNGGQVVPELERRTLIESSILIVNKSTYKLNDKVFNMIDEARIIQKIHRKTNDVRMVYLGNFHRGMGHVVVEDTFQSRFDEFLKAEKHIQFLSLQGISRIHELPESVCKLAGLLVLDLRSCQDLKSLPKDIGNLNNLRCLDLSKCYQLDYIPKGITKLINLTMLMGFIITAEENLQQLKDSKHQVAEFADLKYLKNLIKLTVCTRRMSFPTNQDLQTLNQMRGLRKLKVKWVKSFVQSNPTAADDVSSEEIPFYTEGFPETLQKLELQAAPDSKASQLLGLISKRSRYHRLQKIIIRGGTLQTKLYPNHYYFPHVKILRLRYLPLLHMNWHDFQLSFPNLSDLQIVECPNLIFFPCDQNGDWIQSESSW